MKYDGKCLHGAGPGSPGDCIADRREGSVLCEEHHQAVLDGRAKAPPLRMVHDYQGSARFIWLVSTDDEP